MDANAYGKLGLPAETRWRRPPWGVPSGRRAPFWGGLLEVLPWSALWMSLVGALNFGVAGAQVALGGRGAGMFAVYVAAAVLAFAYGVSLVVMAQGPHPRPKGFANAFVAVPAAKRWYGLAFVIASALAWGWSFMFRPTSAATENLTSLWLAAPAAFAVCLLVARACSTREAKRAILAGLAPSYPTSPDGRWWWGGDAWLSVFAVYPEHALRSPDGNHWWTGHSWAAMPPRKTRPYARR